MLLWALLCAQSFNPRASEGKCFRRNWERVGILMWEIPEIASFTKGECVKIIFCLWQTTHLLPSSWMQCKWCWRLQGRHAVGWVWRSHGSSWRSAWGVCRLLCWRTTALLVWAMNSSELGKWHILGFNFAGWSPCQGYSVSQNHRISKCVLTANRKINMPSSFSWSLTENPVSQ